MKWYERVALVFTFISVIMVALVVGHDQESQRTREQGITRCADAYISSWPEGLTTVRHTSVCENLTGDDLAVAYMRAATVADGG